MRRSSFSQSIFSELTAVAVLATLEYGRYVKMGIEGADIAFCALMKVKLIRGWCVR